MKTETKQGVSRSTIRKMCRKLRNIIETDKDNATVRIAQGMEIALRWATEDTVGWKIADEPAALSKCLKRDNMGI